MAPVVDSVGDASWARYAQEVSPRELARTCTQSRIARIPERQVENAQRRERRLRFWTDDLQMIRISAAFAPEDGSAVRRAIETLAERPPVSHDDACQPQLAANADALAVICAGHLCGTSDDDVPERPVQLIVHADLDVLGGQNPRGRGHIEDGPALSLAALRQIGCDASVKVLLEKNGTPVAAPRTRHRIPPAMRWMVQERDRTCVVPGCVRPAKRCQVHHLDFELVKNPTEMWNLATLCKRCHRLLHLDEFSIIRTPDGDLRFVGEDGQTMGFTRGGWWKRPKTRAGP